MDDKMIILIENLNKRHIHPDKDYDLFLEELQNIGLFFNEDDGIWSYNN